MARPYCKTHTETRTAVLTGYELQHVDFDDYVEVRLFCKFEGKKTFKYPIEPDDDFDFAANLRKLVYYQLKGSNNGDHELVSDLHLSYLATPEQHHDLETSIRASKIDQEPGQTQLGGRLA